MSERQTQGRGARVGGGRRNLDCDRPPSSHPEEGVGDLPKESAMERAPGDRPGAAGARARLCAFLTPVRRLEPKLRVPAGSAPPEGPRATALASLLGL